MTAPLGGLPHQLRVAVLALLAGWFTMLSWGVLTEDFAEVWVPLLLIGLVLGVGGALARWRRLSTALIVAGQVLVGALLVLGTTTGSLLPTPTTLEAFATAVSQAVESSRAYSAPVDAGVPPVHPLLLIGGVLVLLMVDFLACTLRWAPVAGLVLLAAYTLPVTVTGIAAPWWLFAVTAGLFLGMLFLQHSDHLASWGRSPAGEPGGFSVRTGAIGNTALALGSAAIALAVLVPMAVPTLEMSLFDGAGPGSREVQVKDPMVDLRRDLQRGEDVPLIWVTTRGPRPSYLRLSVLTRFSGERWTAGDREIPESQGATGELPALDGVARDVPRVETPEVIRISPDFDSTWLPTPALVTRVEAGPDWRYDLSTRDFIGARDDVTTAGRGYGYTAVELDYDAASMNRAVSGAAAVRSIYTEVPASLSNEVRRLAATVTADAPTRFQKAQLLQKWFRETGGFRYDLSAVESVGDGGADLLAFLDEDSGRVGYCEQFAASMAIMARVLGIPSRVAVGFLEPRRSAPSMWEYSAWDLHTWPELYFPGSGWVRFEPTPSDRAGQAPGYTDAQIAAPTQSPSPSASRSNELRPDRGASPRPEAGDDASDAGAVPWVLLLVGMLTVLLVAGLLLTPRLVRRSRRRRRLGVGIEEAWAELRDVTLDLGHAWPRGRSPRRTGEWIGRLLAHPSPGNQQPDRPRRGREQAPEAALALDRLVSALERSRYARAGDPGAPESVLGDATLVEESLTAGVSPRARRRATWWPSSVLRPLHRGRTRASGGKSATTPDAESVRTLDELVG